MLFSYLSDIKDGWVQFDIVAIPIRDCLRPCLSVELQVNPSHNRLLQIASLALGIDKYQFFVFSSEIRSK